jgi:uroporphyrinogen decarboxylase
MNSKERVLATVNHNTPDRVAIDYIAREETTKGLIERYELSSHEELLQLLDVDLRGFRPEYTADNFGKGYSDPTLRIEGDIHYDIWGVGFKANQTEVGFYMDLADSPLKDATTVAEIEAHTWPSADDYDYTCIAEQVDTHSEYWTWSHSRGIFEISWFLRGFDNFMVDLMVNKDLANAVMDQVQAFLFEKSRRVLEAGRGKLDMMEYNDDVGGQNGILISPDTWREMCKPRMAAFIDMCREYGARARYHSCGGYREIIPDLIEIGVDVLNPVQTIATGMDAEELARDFGQQLTFNGGIDTQDLLPYATADEVRKETRRIIDIFTTDCAYILDPSHVFQADVPLDSVIAVYEEALGRPLVS